MAITPGQPEIGYERRCYVGAQAALATYKTIDLCTAIQTSSVDFGANEMRDRVNSGDRSEQRYAVDLIEYLGRHPLATWSISQVLRPSGTAGTAPRSDALWEAAIGLGTNTPATSEVYTEDEDLSVSVLGLSLYYGSEHHMDFVGGAICQKVEVSIATDGQAMVTFSGVARERGHAHQMTLTANPGLANEAGPSTVAVTRIRDSYSASNVFSFKVDNEVLLLTAPTSTNYTNGTATFARAQAGTVAAEHAQNSIAYCYTPATAYAGSPIFGYDCTVSVDNSTTDLTFLSGSFTYENGLAFLEQECGEDRPTACRLLTVPNPSWSVTFQAREDTRLQLYSAANQQTALDLHFQLGSTAGNKVDIDLPYAVAREVTDAVPAEADGLLEFTVSGIGKNNALGTYNACAVAFL